jgi:hypothetical protein
MFVGKIWLFLGYLMLAPTVLAFDIDAEYGDVVYREAHKIPLYEKYNMDKTVDGFEFEADFSRFHVCAGVGCNRSIITQVDSQQAQAVKYLFSHVKSAHDERDAIQKAIGLMEYFVGRQPEVDLWDDKAMNDVFSAIPKSAQNDCVDESTNAMSYLFVFDNEGLLKYHRIQPIVRRAYFFIDQHFTATIQDKRSGNVYAVDSWFMPNGYPALVMALADWKAKKEDPLIDKMQRSIKPAYRNMLAVPEVKRLSLDDVKQFYE